MYRIFIEKKNKQKAINIICEGINEYVEGGIEAYLKEYGYNSDDNIIDTSELYVDKDKVVFITEIFNEVHLLELMIDGRKNVEKLAIYWDADYLTCYDLLSEI